MNKTKWVALGAMLAGGAMLFANGCLGALWQGFNMGWPAHNRFLNVGLEALNEVLFS